MGDGGRTGTAIHLNTNTFSRRRMSVSYSK